MPCLLCSHSTCPYFFYGRFSGLPYGLVRCRNCGVVQTEPAPTTEVLAKWYQCYDVLGEREPYYQALQANDPWSTPEGKEILERFDLVKEKITHYPLPITHYRLLDVGSGHGLFLDLVKRAGWREQGIELNTQAAERSRERFGVSVYVGTIETFSPGAESYDAVTLWDIFEHVPDPRGLIRRAGSVLLPGGLLLIETPNIDALLDRIIILLARLGSTGPAQTFYGLHHLTLWNQKAITQLLKEEGFTVREIRFENTPASRVFRGAALHDRIMRFGVGLAQWAGAMLGKKNKMIVIAEKSE
ncbi:MAG: class I SAM-dependent methyltransferase [bacterium]|nr:class I SAM-dependent methyltransferase [bacterium]